MINRISDAQAVKLANEAAELAQKRRPSAEVLAKLRLAMTFAKSEENKRQIAGCILVVESRAPSVSSGNGNWGCLIAIGLAILVFVLGSL
jgi:hypothetical protein